MKQTENMHLTKRTKIVATIGPASSSPEVLEAMAMAGMNVVRLNMSHGDHSQHEEVIRLTRQISKKLAKPLAVLVDLQGPKIRLGKLPDTGIKLQEGEIIKFRYGDKYAENVLPVQYDLSKHVKPGQPLYLRDGMIEAEIKSIHEGIISAETLNEGTVYSKQGINLPDTNMAGDIFTEKDLHDIKFAATHDVDYVALSFVQTGLDIERLKQRLQDLRSEALIIAKIETKAAIEHIDSIVENADAIMVARGDLAIEIGPERVPVIQRKLVQLGQIKEKPVIVATQMLESMINSPQPTRAEVSDVAAAVAQGTDAVMLSAESATGKYPVETIKLMKRVVLYNEHSRVLSISRQEESRPPSRDAISLAVITLAKQTGARLILAETSTGRIARHIVSFRPEILVLGVTHSVRTYNQLALVWGTRSYLIQNAATAHAEMIATLKAEHNINAGDVIIRTSGSHVGISGKTNTIQIEKIS